MDSQEYDLSTILGIFCAFSLVFLAIFLGGGAKSFFDIKSLLIVIGGTVGATLVNYPLEEFKRSLFAVRTALVPDNSPAILRIRKLIDMSRRKRKDGLMALNADIYREHDAYLKKSINLVLDNLPTDEIRELLTIELSFLEERHRKAAEIFQTMGSISPAMGLIGTLIGLIQMLQNLDDPSQIGPAMAIALLTTFYGALFANLVFLPLAGKLRARSEEEMHLKEITIEGIAGLAEDMNPRLLEQRLLCFLSPNMRASEYE